MTVPQRTSFLPVASDTPSEAAPRRLSDRLATLAFGAVQWPWLLRSLSGGPTAARQELLALLELSETALPPLGSWKADAFFLRMLAEHIRAHRPDVVVELGAGTTSFVAARALALWGRGTLVSFDQHAPFVASVRDWLASHDLAADLRVAPLGPPPPGWPGAWYTLSSLPERIDLLLVDGPPWTVHPLARGAAETLFDRIPVGGVVMLDDAARPGERLVAARWKSRWPQFRFRFVPGGTKGTLVGMRLA
ncbi:class I SAM-dependent methyltransferase [Thermaurantiacus tibetensis]|uniref:class I SAM-dependent methyltransferase n=1 Tax=Thermaurantiacus tibetensis TaxID=2759035 RepID=UPI00188ED19D|nr:class I SAM-dependent methyltransferase [Thermaurantiacus tibetensis]